MAAAFQNTLTDATFNQETTQRLNTAQSLMRMGTLTSNSENAEAILDKACELLEWWSNDYDEEIEIDGAFVENPFTTLLAQARHRLGQISLQRGKLLVAARLFLQVLIHDHRSLSPPALAMTWYDVSLIYMAYGRLSHAQAALKESWLILMQRRSQTGHADDILIFHVEEAMFRLLETWSSPKAEKPPLLWSAQFTLVTYNCRESSQQKIAGDVAKCDTFSEWNVWAAGAA